MVWVPDMRLRHYVAPERMTLAYLTRVLSRLRAGRNPTQGPSRRRSRLRRAPLGHSSGGPVEDPQLLARVRGNRQAALVALRQYQYYSGMAAECFVLHREKSAATTGA